MGAALLLAAGCGCENAATSADQPEITTEAAGAAYVNDGNFREVVFESALPVLVDFTATWCAPCKEVDPIVDDLAAEMDGKTRVVKLDIDDSSEIYRQLPGTSAG